MSKRFIDTTLWTQNKWFRKLAPKYKLFWIYLFCNCDTVGVWEEDFELASFIIGDEYIKEEIVNAFANKLKWFNNKKLWIIEFCDFQYGLLVEENITNKPHQSYITLLKKHSLWIDYTKSIKYPINRVKEKDKDKEEEKDKDKEMAEKVVTRLEFFDIFLRWLHYKRKRGESYKSEDSTTQAYKKLLKISGRDLSKAIEQIEDAMANNYAGFFADNEKGMNNSDKCRSGEKLSDDNYVDHDLELKEDNEKRR